MNTRRLVHTTSRSTKMISMQEALARERMSEARRIAREQRAARDARRWLRLQRMARSAHKRADSR
jgi:hypothetical protein